MKKTFPYMISALFVVIVSCKKEGCTDPLATNYNEEIKEKNDDGSCVYPDPLLVNDFTPPSGPDLSAPDLESPAYFRLMKATSPDGITFTTTGEIITDQANVPDMIIKDEKIFLYYTGWEMGSTINATSVAVSADYGETWYFNYCSFSGFGTNVQPVDPDPVLLSNGTIRMFATTDIGGIKSVLCYESSDGTNFTFVDTAAHSSTDHIFDSNTFELNGTWHMYGINSLNPTHWHLTSTNGINFNVAGTSTFMDGTDQHFITNGYVTGSSYRIFSSFIPGQDLKSFISTDGVNWTIESGSRLNFGGSSSEVSYLKDPAVIKLPDNTYLMVYVTRMI